MYACVSGLRVDVSQCHGNDYEVDVHWLELTERIHRCVIVFK